ncbi:hypothetical protein [Ekhidna sp.]|uniref:hypothetical protein n=1 Tax=Ekhidna sp. TaxID=2608089 RepID=UPI003C7C5C03
MKSLVTFFIAICMVWGSYASWPQPKRGFYFKLNQWWVVYDQFYSETGHIFDSRTRSIGNTSIYAEYGFTDRLTGIVYFPFFSKHTLFEQKNATNGNVIEEGDKVSGVGDSEITLKYALLTDNPIIITTSLVLGLPLGQSDGGYDGSLQTGDGEFNQMLRLDVGGSMKIGKHYPYFLAFGAYNNRSSGFSDEFRYGLEAGISLGILTPLIRFMSVQSLYNGSLNESLFGTYLSGNNYESTIISPELIINFTDKWGLALNYTKPLSGQLSLASASFAVGIFLDMDSL